MSLLPLEDVEAAVRLWLRSSDPAQGAGDALHLIANVAYTREWISADAWMALKDAIKKVRR